MKNDGFSQDGYRPREVESVLRVVARSVSSPIADLMNQHLSIFPPPRRESEVNDYSWVTNDRIFHLWFSRKMNFNPEEFVSTPWYPAIVAFMERNGKTEETAKENSFPTYRRNFQEDMRMLFDGAVVIADGINPSVNSQLLDIFSKPRLRLWPLSATSRQIQDDIQSIHSGASPFIPEKVKLLTENSLRGWNISGGWEQETDNRNLVVAKSSKDLRTFDAVTARCDLSFNTISLFIHQAVILSSTGQSISVAVAQPKVNHRNYVTKLRIHDPSHSRHDQRAGYMATLNSPLLSEKLPFYKGKMIGTPYVAGCADDDQSGDRHAAIEACVLPNASYRNVPIAGTPVALPISISAVAKLFAFFFNQPMEEVIDLTMLEHHDSVPGYVATAALSRVLTLIDKKFDGLDSPEQWIHLFQHVSSKVALDQRLHNGLLCEIPTTLDLLIQRTRRLFQAQVPIRLGILEGLGRITATIYCQQSLVPESREEDCTGLVRRQQMLLRGCDPLTHLGISVSDFELICVGKQGFLDNDACLLCQRHSHAQQAATHSGRALSLTDIMIDILKTTPTTTVQLNDLRARGVNEISSSTMIYLNRFLAQRTLLTKLLHNEAIHDALLKSKVIGDTYHHLPNWWKTHVMEYVEYEQRLTTTRGDMPSELPGEKRKADSTTSGVPANLKRTVTYWNKISPGEESVMERRFQQDIMEHPPSKSSKVHNITAHFWKIHFKYTSQYGVFVTSPKFPLDCLYYLATIGWRVHVESPDDFLVQEEADSLLPSRRNRSLAIDNLCLFIENQGAVNDNVMIIVNEMRDHGPPATFYRPWSILDFLSRDTDCSAFATCIAQTTHVLNTVMCYIATMMKNNRTLLNMFALGQCAVSSDLLVMYNELGPWICTLRSKEVMLHCPILYRLMRYDIFSHILDNTKALSTPSNVPVAIILLIWLSRTTHIFQACGERFMKTQDPADLPEQLGFQKQHIDEIYQLAQLGLVRIKPTWNQLLDDKGIVINEKKPVVHVRCPAASSIERNPQAESHDHSDGSAGLHPDRHATIDDFRMLIQFNRHMFTAPFFKYTTNIDGFSIFEATTMLLCNRMPSQSREPPFDVSPWNIQVFDPIFYKHLERLLKFCNLEAFGKLYFKDPQKLYDSKSIVPLWRLQFSTTGTVKDPGSKWSDFRNSVYGQHFSVQKHSLKEPPAPLPSAVDVVPDQIELFSPFPSHYHDPTFPVVASPRAAKAKRSKKRNLSDVGADPASPDNFARPPTKKMRLVEEEARENEPSSPEPSPEPRRSPRHKSNTTVPTAVVTKSKAKKNAKTATKTKKNAKKAPLKRKTKSIEPPAVDSESPESPSPPTSKKGAVPPQKLHPKKLPFEKQTSIPPAPSFPFAIENVPIIDDDAIYQETTGVDKWADKISSPSDPLSPEDIASPRQANIARMPGTNATEEDDASSQAGSINPPSPSRCLPPARLKDPGSPESDDLSTSSTVHAREEFSLKWFFNKRHAPFPSDVIFPKQFTSPMDLPMMFVSLHKEMDLPKAEKTDFIRSCLDITQNHALLQIIYSEMVHYMVDKYPPGHEFWEKPSRNISQRIHRLYLRTKACSVKLCAEMANEILPQVLSVVHEQFIKPLCDDLTSTGDLTCTRMIDCATMYAEPLPLAARRAHKMTGLFLHPADYDNYEDEQNNAPPSGTEDEEDAQAEVEDDEDDGGNSDEGGEAEDVEEEADEVEEEEDEEAQEEEEKEEAQDKLSKKDADDDPSGGLDKNNEGDGGSGTVLISAAHSETMSGNTAAPAVNPPVEHSSGKGSHLASSKSADRTEMQPIATPGHSSVMAQARPPDPPFTVAESGLSLLLQSAAKLPQKLSASIESLSKRLNSGNEGPVSSILHLQL